MHTILKCILFSLKAGNFFHLYLMNTCITKSRRNCEWIYNYGYRYNNTQEHIVFRNLNIKYIHCVLSM